MNINTTLKDYLGEEKYNEVKNFLNVNDNYIHLKTGNLYKLIDIILDVTNATEGRLMIIYQGNSGKYCREAKEFFEKFTPMDLDLSMR